jgi:plasmid replication initiation protein
VRNPKELRVVKANILIETPQNLSTFEQRIVLYVISQIKKDDEAFQEYEIDIPLFRKLVGIEQGYNNQIIKEKLTELLKKVVQLNKPSSTPNSKYTLTHWLSSAEVDFENSIIRITVDPKLKPYLLQLKSSFTSYHLKQVIRFNNKYSFKVYELLKQYQLFKMRIFTLDDLRYFLGIEEGKYRVYKNFKNRVLYPVQAELKEKSDIRFEFRQVTRGRKVIGLRFSIHINEVKPIQEISVRVIDLVPEQHRSKQTIRDVVAKYLERHDEVYVRRNVVYANKKAKKNYRLYLAQSLQNDWGLGMAEDEAEKQRKQDVLRLQLEAEEQERNLHNQVADKKKKEVLAAFSKFPKSEQLTIKEKANQKYQMFKWLDIETRIWMYLENELQ